MDDDIPPFVPPRNYREPEPLQRCRCRDCSFFSVYPWLGSELSKPKQPIGFCDAKVEPGAVDAGVARLCAKYRAKQPWEYQK